MLCRTRTRGGGRRQVADVPYGGNGITYEYGRSLEPGSLPPPASPARPRLLPVYYFRPATSSSLRAVKFHELANAPPCRVWGREGKLDGGGL